MRDTPKLADDERLQILRTIAWATREHIEKPNSGHLVACADAIAHYIEETVLARVAKEASDE